MIKLHFAPRTRAVRIAWLLEELALPYELVRSEFLPTAKNFFAQATPSFSTGLSEGGRVAMRWTRALIAAVLVSWILLAPLSAGAHGPTIRVSSTGARPSQLAIPAGTTIHFHNTNAGGSVCTVIAKDGSFQSPPLAGGEGWHFTFEKEGSYPFRVEGSGREGLVLVGPAK